MTTLDPRVAETHTGLVVLAGELAYKIKKPVVTDFLDFSDVAQRERACAHEVTLNRRLAPDTYLGVGHFDAPGSAAPEPVIVMRRHPDERRLATMVRGGQDVTEHLDAIARVLAGFHAEAERGPAIDAQARVDAVAARWSENLDELAAYAAAGDCALDPRAVADTRHLVDDFIAGRAVLFAGRISGRRIVDGHADLLADDIFCLPDGPVLLDCLEFDDRLRYVDVVDDAAFLAMDLEFLGRGDFADHFIARYLHLTGDDAPESLRHFYTAYRAVVRAKVDCVRVTQGNTEAGDDARRHLDIALAHLRRGAVRLILIGGGPGSGKTTLSHALAEHLGALVISTDDIRAEMVGRHEITGEPGVLGAGLYSPDNVDSVYGAVLLRAHLGLCEGRTVILDGTWSDERHRVLAREIAAGAAAAMTEFVCAASLDVAVSRIRTRTATTSQVTPEIATMLADRGGAEVWAGAHRIDTTRELSESVAAALDICHT
jgi:aminoglycoside phosphotransferase family enzyme/predicted kinase